ncbi:MAG: type III pantothenate kinase [Candidatus Latescibacteria bacterium]|nr:type III pantothenate kinase [Candidatus Latescibacterota bacterium]
MIALFDSGNSYLHFGRWDGITVTDAMSIPYPENIDQIDDTVSSLFKTHKPEAAAACSVNSRWRKYLFEAIHKQVSGKLYVARYAFDIEVTVAYDNPSTFGIDRALGAYAAYKYFKNSCVVVDAGTAVTIDAVEPDGKVRGGYIFPGKQTLIHGLSLQTDLPYIDNEYIGADIGTDTASCINSGATLGIAGAVSNLVRYACEFVHCNERVVITGGGAKQLRKYIPIDMVYKPSLVLEGLGFTFDKLPKYA